MVFTRNPLGQVPGAIGTAVGSFPLAFRLLTVWTYHRSGQHYALPVVLWVKTAELLIGRAPRAAAGATEIPQEETTWYSGTVLLTFDAKPW